LTAIRQRDTQLHEAEKGGRNDQELDLEAPEKMSQPEQGLTLGAPALGSACLFDQQRFVWVKQ
jgi:hypothetical protein